ncbi:unnamed protein product, partial [Didymodactylos carnosus]
QVAIFLSDGGADTPFIKNNPSIIVIQIVENGLAHRDKQLKLYDVILRVNDNDFTNIKHQTAIDTLKTSGNKVRLLIHRLSPPFSEEIELEQFEKLGISIAGGIGNGYFTR